MKKFTISDTIDLKELEKLRDRVFERNFLKNRKLEGENLDVKVGDKGASLDTNLGGVNVGANVEVEDADKAKSDEKKVPEVNAEVKVGD